MAMMLKNPKRKLKNILKFSFCGSFTTVPLKQISGIWVDCLGAMSKRWSSWARPSGCISAELCLICVLVGGGQCGGKEDSSSFVTIMSFLHN